MPDGIRARLTAERNGLVSAHLAGLLPTVRAPAAWLRRLSGPADAPARGRARQCLPPPSLSAYTDHADTYNHLADNDLDDTRDILDADQVDMFAMGADDDDDDDDNQDGSDVDGGAVSEPDRLDCADRSAC